MYLPSLCCRKLLPILRSKASCFKQDDDFLNGSHRGSGMDDLRSRLVMLLRLVISALNKVGVVRSQRSFWTRLLRQEKNCKNPRRECYLTRLWRNPIRASIRRSFHGLVFNLLVRSLIARWEVKRSIEMRTGCSEFVAQVRFGR